MWFCRNNIHVVIVCSHRVRMAMRMVSWLCTELCLLDVYSIWHACLQPTSVGKLRVDAHFNVVIGWGYRVWSLYHKGECDSRWFLLFIYFYSEFKYCSQSCEFSFVACSCVARRPLVGQLRVGAHEAKFCGYTHLWIIFICCYSAVAFLLLSGLWRCNKMDTVIFKYFLVFLAL